MASQPDLVFIYNAESGLLNKLKDAVHKTFSPSTYPCKLCDVTYSPVHMRGQWRRFVNTLPINVEFSYIDLIEAAHPDAQLAYPSAVLRQAGKLEPFISQEEMNRPDTIDELIDLVNRKLSERAIL
ncbi:MAG: GTPase [Pseudomonadota bacterium]